MSYSTVAEQRCCLLHTRLYTKPLFSSISRAQQQWCVLLLHAFVGARMHARLPTTAGVASASWAHAGCVCPLSALCKDSLQGQQQVSAHAFPVTQQDCSPASQWPGKVAAGTVAPRSNTSLPSVVSVCALGFHERCGWTAPLTACMSLTTASISCSFNGQPCLCSSMGLRGVAHACTVLRLGSDAVPACTPRSCACMCAQPLALSRCRASPASCITACAGCPGMCLWLQRAGLGQIAAGLQGLFEQARASAHSSCLGSTGCGFLAWSGACLTWLLGLCGGHSWQAPAVCLGVQRKRGFLRERQPWETCSRGTCAVRLGWLLQPVTTCRSTRNTPRAHVTEGFGPLR